MSLVPTFVQSAEGNWYKNPTIRGEKYDEGKKWKWFVCWDDDEPIELVIAMEFYTDPMEIVKLLKDFGWKVAIGFRNLSANRVFGDNWFFAAGRSYCVDQRSAPTDALFAAHGIKSLGKEMPSVDGVYYGKDFKGIF